VKVGLTDWIYSTFVSPEVDWQPALELRTHHDDVFAPGDAP
jgi:hypothetical protein